jgi:putative spermidine/putrescine transport system ATP-binding protein/putrescine transport system ATP-binding protein
MSSSGLDLVDVIKRFGDHAAVDGASLSVQDGEIVALLGPSGCGKTTTLRLIAGFESLDAGTIAIGGSDIAKLPPYRRDIGLVFQDYALFPHLSVAANINYGMKQRGIPQTEQDRRRGELLRLTRLEGLDERRPLSLSGGQQQRVALARALAIAPKLLLLDEPLSNLDAKLREALRIELRDILRAVGTTTLVVTHDQSEAIGLADRIALMNRGRIVQVGTAREIYEEPATRFVAEFIGQSIWFSGQLQQGPHGAQFVTGGGLVLAVNAPANAGAVSGLSIRPEHVHLSARPSDVNRIPAAVTNVEFFGAELIVSCRLDSGGRAIRIPIRSDDEAIPIAGARIELGISPDRCKVIADD